MKNFRESHSTLSGLMGCHFLQSPDYIRGYSYKSPLGFYTPELAQHLKELALKTKKRLLIMNIRLFVIVLFILFRAVL